MLRLERPRAAGKDFSGTGLGTQLSDHWVLITGQKPKWAEGSPAPRGPRQLDSQPVSSFKAVQTRDSLALALLEGFSQNPKHPFNTLLPRADSQKPPPQPPTGLCGEPPANHSSSQSQPGGSLARALIGHLVLPVLECWVLNNGMRKGDSPGRVLKGREPKEERG